MILATGWSQCVPVWLWSDPAISTWIEKSCGGLCKSHMAGAKGAVGGLVGMWGSLSPSHLTAFYNVQFRGRRQKKDIIFRNFWSLNFPSWKAGFAELKLIEWHLWSADAIWSTELSVAKQLQRGPSTLHLDKGHRKREYINLLSWWELNMNRS